MRPLPALSCLLALLLSCYASHAQSPAPAGPKNFLYTSSGNLQQLKAILNRPDIDGAQIVYSWKSLEPRRGEYDFSKIQHDLALLNAVGKKLFIQVQDRFFSANARYIPDYLLHERPYGGGLVAQMDNPGVAKPKAHGWVAAQWNPAVRHRYQALLQALAATFDGKIYGINLPETAADLDPRAAHSGFSCDAYFHAEMENLKVARHAFKKSFVVQYVNFWPCEWNNDHRYMERLFRYAARHGVGLGGPDIIPYRKAQMKNSYPFFKRYKGRLRLVAMAVQEPTLTYRNPKTGRHFTQQEFRSFAQNYLGADIIFWSADTPWLRHTPRKSGAAAALH